jgi:hypothetical protein
MRIAFPQQPKPSLALIYLLVETIIISGTQAQHALNLIRDTLQHKDIKTAYRIPKR